MKSRTGRRIARLVLAMSVLIALQQPIVPAQEGSPASRKSIEVGVGIVGSSGLGDAIDRRFPSSRYDVSGSGSLFDVECGLGFPVGRSVTVTPRVRMLGKSVTIKAYEGLPGSQYAVFVVLPGVSVRYAFASTRPQFYLGGDIALVSAHADEEILTMEGRGVSIGANVGMSFKNRVDIEIGRWSVPVRESQPRQVDADYGGLGLIIRSRWFL